MAARSVLACISLIAFAITSQPAFAANDDTPPPANPSTRNPAGTTHPGTNPAATPAKRQHKHHAGKHHRQQTPAPQQQGSTPSDG